MKVKLARSGRATGTAAEAAKRAGLLAVARLALLVFRCLFALGIVCRRPRDVLVSVVLGMSCVELLHHIGDLLQCVFVCMVFSTPAEPHISASLPRVLTPS